MGKGLLGTLASAAAAAVIALVLGLVLLIGRLSRLRIARWPAVAVIEFLRGVPTLLLIYVCFLVLPSVGIKLSAYWMLTLPVGLSTAAVVAEVYRAGVLAVPRRQTDAARALGSASSTSRLRDCAVGVERCLSSARRSRSTLVSCRLDSKTLLSSAPVDEK